MKPWEEVDIVEISLIMEMKKVENAIIVANYLADKYQSEVRWNFQGNENGNYVGTDYKFEKLAKK